VLEKMMTKSKYLIFIVGMLALLTINAYSQTLNNRTKTMTQTNVTKADESYSFEEYKAVEHALQPYINSAKTGDGKQIRTPFYDHAHIVGSVGETFYNADLDAFEESINEVGASPEVKHHIAWIDISGPAAAAKVEFYNWGGYRFTDFFVLYKHEGQWKISGKVYDSHSNN
jgi:hypothetical protein